MLNKCITSCCLSLIWPHQPHQWAWNDSDKHNVLTCSTNKSYRHTSTWVDKVYDMCSYWPLFVDSLNRFIEGNKIETITKNAFRGLRDLTHLWVCCHPLRRPRSNLQHRHLIITERDSCYKLGRKKRQKDDSNVRVSGLSLFVSLV